MPKVHRGGTVPVCRDIYHMGDNASQFERLLNEKGILLPAGTINTERHPIAGWDYQYSHEP